MVTIESKNNGKSRKDKSLKRKEKRVDETIMDAGDYEVTKETTFDIEIYLACSDGRWIVVDGDGDGVRKEVVTMRMWNYDEMVMLRKKATEFDNVKKIHTIDQDMLNRYKIQKLLVDWTFGEANKRIILHKANGVMTDGSWDKFKMLQPNIIDYVIRKMNSVYEYGL